MKLFIEGTGQVSFETEEELMNCLGFIKAMAAPEYRAMLDGSGTMEQWLAARCLSYYAWRQANDETDSND